jgi:fumarate reductase subunit D
VNLDKRILAVGIVLIIIALILGAIRLSGAYDFGFAYGSGGGWYFYGLAGIIGLIGIILAAWSYMRKPVPASAPATNPASAPA